MSEEGESKSEKKKTLPNEKELKDSSKALSGGFVYLGMISVSIGLWLISPAVALIWIGICFFGLAYGVLNLRKKRTKENDKRTLDSHRMA